MTKEIMLTDEIKELIEKNKDVKISKNLQQKLNKFNSLDLLYVEIDFEKGPKIVNLKECDIKKQIKSFSSIR